jgi:hypothetical protein
MVYRPCRGSFFLVLLLSKEKITLKDRIEQLPELPVESFKSIGILAYSEKKPIVTLKPHRYEPEKKSPPVPPAFVPNKSSVWSRKYYVQVCYPQVVCQIPWDSMENKEVDPATFFAAEKSTRESLCPKGNAFVEEAMKERSINFPA